MNKDKELKRLAGEVFEGAFPLVTHAAMNEDGRWCHHTTEPEPDMVGKWLPENSWERCWSFPENQPETDLPWTETLLRRGDYE
jgi:hypothetical protein